MEAMRTVDVKTGSGTQETHEASDHEWYASIVKGKRASFLKNISLRLVKVLLKSVIDRFSTFFLLARISVFLHAKWSATFVGCAHLRKSVRDRCIIVQYSLRDIIKCIKKPSELSTKNKVLLNSSYTNTAIAGWSQSRNLPSWISAAVSLWLPHRWSPCSSAAVPANLAWVCLWRLGLLSWWPRMIYPAQTSGLCPLASPL